MTDGLGNDFEARLWCGQMQRKFLRGMPVLSRVFFISKLATIFGTILNVVKFQGEQCQSYRLCERSALHSMPYEHLLQLSTLRCCVIRMEQLSC